MPTHTPYKVEEVEYEDPATLMRELISKTRRDTGRDN